MTFQAFVPESVYDRIYSKPMQACGTKTGFPNLSRDIRKEFQLIAADGREDVVKKHCTNIQSCTGISNIHTHHACSVCLVQSSTFTLDCRHGLCSACVAQIGQEPSPWRFQLARCILCRSPNQSPLIMKPPTAGLRILQVDGTRPAAMWQLLRDLRHSTSLNSVPFWEHFDSAIGIDIGTLCHEMNISQAYELNLREYRDLFHNYSFH